MKKAADKAAKLARRSVRKPSPESEQARELGAVNLVRIVDVAEAGFY